MAKATFAPTNTNTIVAKSSKDYKDAYTKDIPHLTKLAYLPQTKGYNHEPVMPNRPMGKTITE